MDAWKIDKTNIPKDGSICDIILSDNKRGLGIVCAIIKNGRFMLNDMDITDKVLKWHKIPSVIVDSYGIFQWDNSNDTLTQNKR